MIISIVYIFLQNNSTALHHAAAVGNNNVITFLLDHGAGVNDVDTYVSNHNDIMCYYFWYALLNDSNIFYVSVIVTGFGKLTEMVHLANCIFLAQLIATLIHYPCTVAILGLADWSAFLQWILPTM